MLVLPYTTLSVSPPIVNSGVFVLPKRIAPEFKSLSATEEFFSGLKFFLPSVPQVLIIFFVSNESFNVNGIPNNGKDLYLSKFVSKN